MENDSKSSNSKILNSKLIDEISYITCDTLKDEFPHIPTMEDISVFCDLCNEFLYYGDIKLHRRIHKCIAFLQINDMKSLSFKTLAKHRDKLRKLSQALSPSQKNDILLKLDSAYSTIYNYLVEDYHQGSFYKEFSKETGPPHIYRNIRDKFTVTETELLRVETMDLFEIASAINRKPGQTDVSIVYGDLVEGDVIFALITGNDGGSAAQFVTSNIHECLISQMSQLADIEHKGNKLTEALRNVPVELDKKLATGLYDDVTFNRWSSCCLETVIFSRVSSEHYRISATNVGDGMIILLDDDNYTELSTLHSMRNENEVKRIKDMGGSISSIDDEIYLNGISNLSQVIGGYGNAKLKAYQLPDPNVISIDINKNKHTGLIIINSQISKLITVEDAVTIFRSEMINPKKDTNFQIDENLDLFTAVTPPNSLCENSDGASLDQNEKIFLSKTIARKISNAAYLNRNYECSLGALVFVISRDT